MKYILLVSIILFSFSVAESETICSLPRELKTARILGDQKQAYEIGHQLHEQWLLCNQYQQHPATIGPNVSSVPYPNLNETFIRPTYNDRWGVGIRIDPNDDIYAVTLAALSNGDIYTISIWDSLSNDHILVQDILIPRFNEFIKPLNRQCTRRGFILTFEAQILGQVFK